MTARLPAFRKDLLTSQSTTSPKETTDFFRFPCERALAGCFLIAHTSRRELPRNRCLSMSMESDLHWVPRVLRVPWVLRVPHPRAQITLAGPTMFHVYVRRNERLVSLFASTGSMAAPSAECRVRARSRDTLGARRKHKDQRVMRRPFDCQSTAVPGQNVCCV